MGQSVGGIGYVLKVFPRLSETFVVNEALALESFGERLSILSLHHPAAAVGHATLRALRAPVTYVEDRSCDEAAVADARKRLTRLYGIAPEMRDRLLPRKYVRLAVSLAAIAREQRLDHLHAHFASRSAHVAALAAGLLGCPYSITAHAKDIYHDEVDAFALRWKIRNASFVATVTDHNLRHLRAMLADEPGAAAKIVRVYNGVDLTRFAASPPPAFDPPLLLGIGRLVEKKGFEVLLAACRELADRGVRFRCEIVGTGEREASLRERIAALDLGGLVALRGALATEEIVERLRSAYALVLPCVVGGDGNVDALPTVIIEAMACGRPVVSTRLSGIPEMVDEGVTGVLVAPGHSTALADALAALLAQPARAAAMGAAGRARAEALFDLYANAARVRDLIRTRAASAAGAA